MDKNIFKQVFAARLCKIIVEKKISRTDLAKKADIKYASLASYLAAQNEGKGALPPLDVMVRLANALGISVDYLCGQDEIAQLPARSVAAPQQTAAQVLLLNLYTAATALNMQTEVQDNGNIALISDNQFLLLFFKQMQHDDDLQAALDKFRDLKVFNGELLDPVTYRLLHGAEEAQ